MGALQLCRAATLCGALTLASLTACSSQTQEPDLGQVGLRLSTESAGIQYRLRGATLVIDGAQSVSLSTEADPSASVLSATLAPGQYTITLVDGWYLERSNAAGFEPVEAELLSDNPIPFSIQSNTLTQAAFRFLVDGVVVDRELPSPLPNVLGFEDDTLWTSSAALSLSDTRLQGRHSLGVSGSNFFYVSSTPLSNLAVTEERVSVAVWLPKQQPNPSWFGDVYLVLNAPSIGLYEVSVGSAALSGLPTGEFSDLEFTLSQQVLDALSRPYSDLVIRLGLSVPYNTTGTYRFDNLRFGGVSACDFACDDGTCVDGICVIECPDSLGDCDGDSTNACETPLLTDSSNCGACHAQCAPGSICQEGSCEASSTCMNTEADCDGNPQNGCEVDTKTNPQHCGGCGNQCDSAQTCINGSCLSGDLDASLQVTADWGSGYCANLWLTNVGSTSTTSWSLVLEQAQASLSFWGAHSSSSGGVHSLTSLDYNAQIAPGTTNTSVGFCASRTGGSDVATIVSVSP